MAEGDKPSTFKWLRNPSHVRDSNLWVARGTGSCSFYLAVKCAVIKETWEGEGQELHFLNSRFMAVLYGDLAIPFSVMMAVTYLLGVMSKAGLRVFTPEGPIS